MTENEAFLDGFTKIQHTRIQYFPLSDLTKNMDYFNYTLLRSRIEKWLQWKYEENIRQTMIYNILYLRTVIRREIPDTFNSWDK